MNSTKSRRLPAEWEPQSFVQFTFPHKNSDWAYMYPEVVACFLKIIETSAKFQPVLVGCHSINKVSKLFKNKTPFPIHFVKVKSNDTWERDHGAITIYQGNDPLLLDFTFNGWGKKFEASLDNQLTAELTKTIWRQNQIETQIFVLEGGAIDSNGLGTLLTTTKCLLSENRNPDRSQQQIRHHLEQVFGTRKVLWLNHGYLAGDDTDSHIDTLARFCKANTIAYVACDDPSDEHYLQLQRMESQLKSFMNEDGDCFDLVPLPFPEACYDHEGSRLPATYANFLILNGAVLVPTYRVPQDAKALEIIGQLFPDRQVIGIDCVALIQQHGSLHCVSMQYPIGVSLTPS